VCIGLPPIDDNPDAFFQPDVYGVSAAGGVLQRVAVTLRTYEAFIDWR
jgi:hypothetical protein